MIHENRNLITGTQEEAQGKRETTHIFKYDRVKSDFCQKCGAWRGQLGLEPTFELYLDHMMIVCAEIKRVLKQTGSLWLNLGDTYGGSACGRHDYRPEASISPTELFTNKPNPQLKMRPKSLLGIPWRLALRLIDEQGWILRNAGIWNKPNSMPSSVKDRLSNSYEFLFHFVKNTKPQYYWNEKTGLMADRRPPTTKQKEGIDWGWEEVGIVDKNVFNVRVRDAETNRFMEKATEEEKKNYGKPKLKKRTYWHSLGYWYDLDAIREPHKESFLKDKRIQRIRQGEELTHKRWKDYQGTKAQDPCNARDSIMKTFNSAGRNPGDVWTINTQPRKDAHFATFSDKLCIKPILATCPAEVCKKCGKARVRIREQIGGQTTGHQARNTPKMKIEGKFHGGKTSHPFDDKELGIYQTIGWTTCSCGEGFRPGILLDPFAGRGTALIMAKKMGRHCVGYELKKEYAKICIGNLEEIDPLFASSR